MRSSRLNTRRRSRIGGTTLQSLTFARTGSAYLDGVSYAAGVARFPNTAGTVGVLVEEATTNLALYSSQLDNAWWSKLNATVTADAATAPDGTLSMDKICVDATASVQHGIYRTNLFSAGNQCLSFYAKAAELSWVFADFGASVSRVFFDLTNGVVGTVGGSISGKGITHIGNGVYYCWLALNNASAGTPEICVSTGNGTISFTGTAGQGAYVWGIQAEAKAYPTTYIPTSAATATRNAETLTIPTAGILRPDRGTIVIKAYVDSPLLANASPTRDAELFYHRTSGNNNWIRLFRGSGSGRFTAQISSPTGTFATTVTGAPTSLSFGWHYFAITWGAGAVTLWVDGASKAAATGVTLPDTLASVAYLGSNDAGANQWNQPGAWLCIYDRVLSNAEMAQATLGNLPSGYTALVDFRRGRFGVSHRRGVTTNDYLNTYCRRDLL